jgi:hypothetical protein
MPMDSKYRRNFTGKAKCTEDAIACSHVTQIVLKNSIQGSRNQSTELFKILIDFFAQIHHKERWTNKLKF